MRRIPCSRLEQIELVSTCENIPEFKKKSPSARTSKGFSRKTVGATRRLLNFFWPASGRGMRNCGGWRTVSRWPFPADIRKRQPRDSSIDLKVRPILIAATFGIDSVCHDEHGQRHERSERKHNRETPQTRLNIRKEGHAIPKAEDTSTSHRPTHRARSRQCRAR